MPTIVFQGHQSCSEPKMVETRTLKLKLSSPNPDSSSLWSSITSTSKKHNEPSYVHPMTKNSFFPKLSSKSLELCTENLGCETGSSFGEEAIISLPSREHNGGENKVKEKLRSRLDSRGKSMWNFPPPLTTISGSNSLQVRPIREGGRLVIEAVEVSSSHGLFKAERSNGRLVLSLFRENDETTDESEVYENVTKELAVHKKNIQKKEKYIEHVEEEEFEKDYGRVTKTSVNENMERNNKEVKFILGINEKFKRPTRCNDGGICKWEPFLVATS